MSDENAEKPPQQIMIQAPAGYKLVKDEPEGPAGPQPPPDLSDPKTSAH